MKSPISQFLQGCSLALCFAVGAQGLTATTKKLDRPPPGGCEVYPIALSLSSVSNISTDTVLSNLRNGANTGDFAWLSWNGNRSQEALMRSLSTPGNSHTYINPQDKKDAELGTRDWVKSKIGRAH